MNVILNLGEFTKATENIDFVISVKYISSEVILFSNLSPKRFNLTTKTLFFHCYPEVRIRISSLSHAHTWHSSASFFTPYCLTDNSPAVYIALISNSAPLSPEHCGIY